ncbi:hypothetical protein [Halorhabdus tiamatea]|uniref:hypothetical protein n=1 Tax=Halorhabdus tiamatea TaxID=430914 RepID=UPI0011D19431|nr:hypothetical protein [Halorhabdus tiamatea]
MDANVGLDADGLAVPPNERRCPAERSEQGSADEQRESAGGEQIRRICEPRRARNAVTSALVV